MFVGAGLKEFEQSKLKREQISQLERLPHVLGEMLSNVPRVTPGDSPSVDRLQRVIDAAQRCTLRFIPSESDGLRVCVYQLEYEEEQQLSGARPGERPIEQAHLVLVGEPQGRSLDPARTEFKYDDEGRYTLQRILAKEVVWCADAKKKPLPGLRPDRSYRCFLSVPIIVDDKVEGMLTCDAISKDDLSRKMISTLRMTAIVAGFGLRRDEIGEVPTPHAAPVLGQPEVRQLDSERER